MKTLIRSERGQAMVLTVISVTVLLGMAAVVVDVGSWFLDRRQLQSGVDSSALAGAQNLPSDSSGAVDAAASYASKNGVGSPSISISSKNRSGDTIDVSASRVSQGFFAKVFNIASVTLHANASATASTLDGVYKALPFGISYDHPDLVCGLPCFNQPATVPIQQVGAPGNFDLIALNGATTPDALGALIESGYGALMKLGDYPVATGVKFNADAIQSAMQDRVGATIVLPIYDSVSGVGSGATYHVISWVSFTITGFDLRSSGGQLYGVFHRLIQSNGETGGIPNEPPYAAISVSLTH
jgi:hypothetical protein